MIINDEVFGKLEYNYGWTQLSANDTNGEKKKQLKGWIRMKEIKVLHLNLSKYNDARNFESADSGIYRDLNDIDKGNIQLWKY